MNPNKVAFTTACIAETDEKAARMIHWLADSCKRFGIDLKPYGMGKSYIDWRQIKIHLWVEYLKELSAAGYTHAFYTDGRDSFMLTNKGEVLDKYNFLGRPAYLVSCEDQCYPFAERAVEFPNPGHQWRYIGAGQFIGEIGYMVDMWAELEKRYGGLEKENHDQGWLELGYVDKVLDRQEFVLDNDCLIFQCVREHIGEELEDGNLTIRNCRVYNQVTGTYPCAIHFPGGYSDPVSGKDHVIEPVWRRLGWSNGK